MKLLEKHFDLAFAAPDGIQKLRELILTLAMQGKLVPQDPKDQPASELLKAIEAEKTRMVREGKIKQPKPLPEIKSEGVPYGLPQEWEWVRLAQLASIQTGKKDVNQGHENGLYPFFSCAAEPLKSNEFSFDCEALLLPGNGANVGLVTYYVGKFEAYQRTYVITDFSQTAPRYVENTLKARFLKSLEGKQYGSAINYIKLGNLTDFLIPLPPLPEQHRIVAKIDQLMARCDELEKLRAERNQKRITIHTAALNRLLTTKESSDFSTAWHFITQHFGELYSVKENVAELRKAILQLAVMGKLVPQDPKDEPASELLRAIEAEKQQLIKEKKLKIGQLTNDSKSINKNIQIPSSWSWVKGVDLFFITKLAGFEYTKYINLLDSGEVPVIRAQNVKPFRLDIESLKYIDLKTSNLLERCALTKEALLVTFIGAGIGDVALFNFEERWHLAPNVAKMEPFTGCEDKVSLGYIAYFLNSQIGRNEIFKHLKSTAQPSISMGEHVSLIERLIH